MTCFCWGSPAQPGPAGTVQRGVGTDGQPGQNQGHGVPEEGQVSGKQIPVQLQRRSPRAQQQLQLPGHRDLSVRGLQSGREGPEWEAWRAFYAIKARFGQLKLPIGTWIKLYHAIIKPILLYGSEIWGPILKFENWDKSLIERTQLEFAKNILRVNRSTSNNACRAELGLYPLHIEIQKRAVQFYHHLTQSDTQSVQYNPPPQCLIL